MNALAQFAAPSSATSGSAVLKADNVGVAFGTGKQYVEAIRNVSFELQQGETLAIVGPSGCGKSTLFNAIAGLLKPTRGHVEVAGRRVDDAAGHVGYMLQKDLLLPWRSVLDNVMLGLEVRGGAKARSRDIAMKLIKAYGLAGFENAKPATLSGGMRQRVAIMRTLAFDPQVILLDEPFSALDFQTRLLLQADVSRIIAEHGKSAILVTHDIGEAIAMADRVLVLSARPATVRALHIIDLPKAGRDPVALRTDLAFQNYFARIWADLEMPAAVP
jgi:NitT/TauT family transport system ATP-binding protein